MFIYLLNRDTIRKLLDQNLFDVQSAIISESGELNKFVPKQDIQEYQYEESNYSVGKGFGSKEQGNFLTFNLSSKKTIHWVTKSFFRHLI